MAQQILLAAESHASHVYKPAWMSILRHAWALTILRVMTSVSCNSPCHK